MSCKPFCSGQTYGAVWHETAGKCKGIADIQIVPVVCIIDKMEYWFDLLLWPLADGIVSNTNIGRKLLHKNIKIPLAETYYVPNGYDLNIFQNMPGKEIVRSELGFSNGQFVVAITGNLKPVKNHRMLIEAARLICEKNNRTSIYGYRHRCLGTEAFESDQKIRNRRQHYIFGY